MIRFLEKLDGKIILWITFWVFAGLALAAVVIPIATDEIPDPPELAVPADAVDATEVGNGAVGDGSVAGDFQLQLETLDDTGLRIGWGLSVALFYGTFAAGLLVLIRIFKSGTIFSDDNTRLVSIGVPVLMLSLMLSFVIQLFLEGRIAGSVGLELTTPDDTFFGFPLLVLMAGGGVMALWDRGRTLQELEEKTI